MKGNIFYYLLAFISINLLDCTGQFDIESFSHHKNPPPENTEFKPPFTEVTETALLEEDKNKKKPSFPKNTQAKNTPELVFDQSSFDQDVYNSKVHFYLTSQKLVELKTLEKKIPKGTLINEPKLALFSPRTNQEVGLASQGDPNAQENATFVAWYNFDNNQSWTFSRDKVINDIKFYAHWEETIFKALFYHYKDSNNFLRDQFIISPYRPQTIHKNGKIKEPNITPALTNQEVGLADASDENNNLQASFLGWYNFGNNQSWNFQVSQVIENIKLYAKWKENFKVSFYQKPGSLIFSLSSIEVLDGNNFTLPIPPIITNEEASFAKASDMNKNLDAIFVEWRDDSGVTWVSGTKLSNNRNIGIKPNKGHLKLYAHWKPTYKIIFYSDSSKSHILQEQIVDEDNPISNPPNPTITPNSNYTQTFLGWAYQEHGTEKLFSSFGSSGTPLNKNVSFYPKWKNTVEVGFYLTKSNAQNSVNKLNQVSQFNQGEILTKPSPPIANNILVGFNNNPDPNLNAQFVEWKNFDGNQVWDFSKPVNKHLKLYATWIETFKVDFYDQKSGKIIYFLPVPSNQKISDVDANIRVTAFNRLGSRTNQEVGFAKQGDPNENLNAQFLEWRNNQNDNRWSFNNHIVVNKLKLYAHWGKTLKVTLKDPYGNELFISSFSGRIPFQKSISNISPTIEADLSASLVYPTNKDAGFSGLPSGQENLKAHFKGWYTQDNLPWDFQADLVQNNLELTCKWLPVIEVGQTASQGVLNSKEWVINPDPITNTAAGFVSKRATNADYKAYFDGWYTKDMGNPSQKYNFDGSYFGKLYGKWSETEKQPKNRQKLIDFLFIQNIDPNLIDVSEILDMSFLLPSSFDKEIGGWDVSHVRIMRNMFFLNNSFDRHLGGWNVAEVNNMDYMFFNSKFNKPIGKWDVRKVRSMVGMFENSQFNHIIGEWNIDKVVDMKKMFYNASNFDQSLDSWKPSCNMQSNGIIYMFQSSQVNQFPPFYNELFSTGVLDPKTGNCTL